jgi:hypothetical protein
MLIRRWHPIKIFIIWIITLTLILALWLLASPHSGADQALLTILGLFISLPAFAITWRWATGLQKPIESQDINRPEHPLVKPGARLGMWLKQLGWGQITLVMFVALASGVSGYFYKQANIFDYGNKWTDISGKNPINLDDPGQPQDGVTFTASHATSLPKDILIHFLNAQTEVKFATALFNRTWDAQLLYRINLQTDAYRKEETPAGSHYTSLHYEKVKQINTECDFYLTFSLYDIDGFFLVGLVSPRDKFTVGMQQRFQGSVDEEIPAQMARRTTRIERNVIIEECRPLNIERRS